jgi:DNA-binding XRE family transcriptional regulator
LRSDYRSCRTDIPASPFCHFEIKTKKPISKAYPKRLATIGYHIRKRRLDLDLVQVEVAAIIDVDEMTIVGWELNHCKPHIRHISAIIDFLGYLPQDLFPAGTVGQ